MGKLERIEIRIGKSAKEEIQRRAQRRGVSVAYYIRMRCMHDIPSLW